MLFIHVLKYMAFQHTEFHREALGHCPPPPPKNSVIWQTDRNMKPGVSPKQSSFSCSPQKVCVFMFNYKKPYRSPGTMKQVLSHPHTSITKLFFPILPI